MPVVIETHPSAFSEVLEIRLVNNRLVLDSQKANYSFGTLHKVMEAGLKRVLKKKNILNSVLMLGYGGGSFAELLGREYRKEVSVTAVEIDPAVIALAERWFPNPQVNLQCEDAAGFAETCTQKYDLIVSDVFIDLEMPGFATGQTYLEHLKSMLDPGGALIINTIYKNKEAAEVLHRKIARLFAEAEHLLLFGENHLFVAFV